MATEQAESAAAEGVSPSPTTPVATSQEAALPALPPRKISEANGEHIVPMTPTKASMKPLPKEPMMTPRLRKKVPWKGKNIMVLLPRDDGRGLRGRPPMPLRRDEIERMFSSWEELGYNVDGFDLVVDGFQPIGTSDSQSRDSWPNFDEVARERAERVYKVTLPDLNAWRDYVNELQEAKLRALGVSLAEPEPEPEFISPPTTIPSRQASAQYPPLPFSPPVPTSSASSNHGLPGFPFPAQFASGLSSAAQSPGLPSPGPLGGLHNKYSRQSISFPAQSSPFQSPPSWHNVGMMHGMESPSLSFNGNMPQSPFGFEPLQPTGSPAFNMHHRNQSLQYPILPHQQMLQQQQPARASPRLQELREVDEEEEAHKSPSKTPEPFKQNPIALQAEIDDAEYHLEESLRNQLEHEDYDPLAESGQHDMDEIAMEPSHSRHVSNSFPVPERFANEPGEPLVLHHPRPHSRGHSLSQNFFRDHNEIQGNAHDNMAQKFAPMSEIAEASKVDESEIETNPSNLGTPVQNFEFPSFGRHQKSMSAASNPWNDAASVNSNGTRRSSHGSKPSLSKLNVQAPEFKFNPTSSFTPGLYNFSSSTFQPAAPVFNAQPTVPVFNAGIVETPPPPPPAMSTFGASSFAPDAPSFAAGQSGFSFSTSGPKFRPDAPAFTPFQPVGSAASPVGRVTKINRRTDSIFGDIQIPVGDSAKSSNKSKAIPIIKPASLSPAPSPRDDGDSVVDGPDGRLIDESRVKRARSSAPEEDDVPLFAEQPKPMGDLLEVPSATPDVNVAKTAELPEAAEETQSEPLPEPKEEHSLPEDNSVEGENVAVDTSMSSLTSEHHDDTKATTAAPSETSQADEPADNWTAFTFGSKSEVREFNDARPFGEDFGNKKPFHRKSLSATAQPFMPGALSYGEESSDARADDDLLDDTPASPTPQPAPVEKLPSPSPEPVEKEPTPEPEPVQKAPSPTPPVPKTKGLSASRFASPPPKPKGLSASRFAKSPSPLPEPTRTSWADMDDEDEVVERIAPEPPVIPEIDALLPSIEGPLPELDLHEPTFEEIDAVMQELENDPSMGVNKSIEPSSWQPTPAVSDQNPYDLQPPSPEHAVSARSPSPPQYRDLPAPAPQPLMTTELEDPFIDPPLTSAQRNAYEEQEIEEAALSDWEAAFSEDEHDKLDQRAQFFDGRVNEVVGALLASRLEPLEKTLMTIQHALASRMRRTPSTHRDMRSLSGELQHSDADDEDEEPVRRSMSPRRDRRLDQIRIAVTEAMAAQQRSQPLPTVAESSHDESAVLRALEEMREHVTTNLRLDFRGEDLKNIVEEAVTSRMLPTPKPDDEPNVKMDELQAKLMDLEQRFYFEQTKLEKEVADRRAAEDLAAELNRKLQSAETRVEVEIINRSVFDQRVNDLEERLRNQEDQCEKEVQQRRAAEDRLSEVQRLLRISSEEENRLREVVDEREQRIKTLEQANGKTSMKMALLEANQNNSAQTHSEMTNKLNILEADLRNVRQDNHNWRTEAERNEEAVHRSTAEIANLTQENKHLQKSLATLSTQLEENERLRESWRSKFMSLQDDMGRAAREIAEETARRNNKEQAILARQDVLDARLQAEAKTRERLEVEMERLQNNERSGMRAVNECKRLEALLGELRTENHNLQEAVYRHKREIEEAKDHGATEVKRTRMVMQTEMENAQTKVNMIREELEEQSVKFRAELDHIKMEADTFKAQSEMMMEEAQASKVDAIAELKEKHQNEMEDLQAKYEHRLTTAVDDGQRTEQHLLERLSLSSSKIEHLQDRIILLEDKLEIAKQAAAAAAQAAKSAGVESGAMGSSARPRENSRLDVPEKISPQALRESIMVLQEQLQAREQRIEELEQVVSKVDPDANAKITKRDDEISWLRELLAVRHSDMQDIIVALSSESYDREAVKDATIRLKANLQMEEQERERAMNGGSAISLPNIAQTIQAATPRVAQTIGPIAAAWGNWRKGNRNNSIALNSPAAASSATPSRSSPNLQNSILGGLMTPPASGLRQTPPVDTRVQPTAFQSTGRRYTAQSNTSSRARVNSNASGRSDNPLIQATPPRRQERREPMTPPMMGTHTYDSDAQPGDFDENDFFNDED
ncbi:hypothetical protein B0I35DRAFT_255069 [Stachybotrys elegans]|uniref:Myosin class II heavy chain n=1 Tax=Stachybotrys elegans TaxID=80388 RepID=A0A8K0SSQ9_9HYPO|nr:hypothetical protein B0I35DRAFT_255069 [Stachybotrys elegans]